ncbi:PilL N-terminal domain-containing protein [Sodalis ligni]|uniref:Type IV pili sensor histidine kinase/response regulator n=1 Tax=Sodalis ligni TaxID=2697027 RepID=A0A4R1N6M8_9GAMM|nr:PilL N-terminal domain-containing protein [Sodalis ligni]TCL02197.1 type IV pili sensor histidine kinase/response regulator [Sodalis ligni]
MPSFFSSPGDIKNASLTGLALVAGLLAGCAVAPTSALSPTPPRDIPKVVALSGPEFVPVVRYGRYTLVELVPQPAQRDLLLQVIDVSVPSAFNANVGDALRHVLMRTGYQLCHTPETVSLYALPLPAAHFRFGPLLLRDALLMLVGPAWDLSVDDANRKVCFDRHVATEHIHDVIAGQTGGGVLSPAKNAQSVTGNESPPRKQ